MAALAGRALTAELDDPGQLLRSLSVVFAGQVLSGDVEIGVQIIRRGRSISQLMATVTNPGATAGLTAIAVFGGPRPGFAFTDLEMPDVEAPDLCRSWREDPPEGVVFEHKFEAGYWDNAEGRAAFGVAPWDTETARTSAEQATWYRFDVAPLLADGTWDPLAVASMCDTMPGAVGQRVGGFGTLPMWFSPSADLHVQLFQPARSEWLLAHNTCRHAGDGYASLDMRMWDPKVGLVAYATQQMFFSWPDGPPSPEQLEIQTS